MEENNMHNFSKSLDFCIVCLILFSGRCWGVDFHYEDCVPKKCREGPEIRFPFYIAVEQESYCGYPGFALKCSHLNGFPYLELFENEYIIEEIYYRNRTFRVYNSAVLSSNCVSEIRNATFPTAQFDYAENVSGLRLFSNCSRLLSEDWVFCGSNDVGERWDLALYDKDTNFTNALDKCGRNIVAPVEEQAEDHGNNVTELLRKGFMLNWTASHCDVCEVSGGRCGFFEHSYHFRCFCPDRPHSKSCKHGKTRVTLVLATAISGGGVFIVCLLVFFVMWRCKERFRKSQIVSKNMSSDPNSNSDIEDRGSLCFGIPIFSYTQLVEATNNFDSSKELGDGGFGTVYYGKLHDGREVAIKRMYENSSRRVEQFMNEIKILTCLRHHNLVSLYGCTSTRSKELLLVYEYIPNGTVADHLHGPRAHISPLTWAVRLNIAIETAAALAYLHESDIIHRDVKTNNILMDDNFSVKVADFGLSRLFPSDVTHISTAPQGTPGYVDPEYHRCYQLTDKSDVYSFGVVLIELISSLPALDMDRSTDEINLASLALERIRRRAFDELIDRGIGYESDGEVRRMSTLVSELAFRCLQTAKDLRPSMNEVVEFLKGVRSGGETGKIRRSPENEDDAVLLKRKDLNFKSSPNGVIEKWISSDSTPRSSLHSF